MSATATLIAAGCYLLLAGLFLVLAVANYRRRDAWAGRASCLVAGVFMALAGAVMALWWPA